MIVFYVFVVLAAMAALTGIFIYEYFDRLRFRIERRWSDFDYAMDKWVYMAYSVAEMAPEYCEKDAVLASKAYDQAKTTGEKLQYVKLLFNKTEKSRSITDGDERLMNVLSRKLEKEREITEKSEKYNALVKRYNQQLSLPFPGSVGRMMNFQPYTAVNFSLPPEENRESEQ